MVITGVVNCSNSGNSSNSNSIIICIIIVIDIVTVTVTDVLSIKCLYLLAYLGVMTLVASGAILENSPKDFTSLYSTDV